MTVARPSLRPAAAALFAVLLSVARAARAEPEDKQAEKALQAAMDEDYLETRFDKAEERLRAAIAKCGDAGCAPAVKARLWMALGTVLSGGKNQLDDAKDAFVEALKLDPKATLDPNLVKTEMTYALEKARAEVGGGSRGAGDLKHAAVAEQRVNTPLPLFVELGEATAARAKKVTVSYLPPGASEWKTLTLKKVTERGFGINVPCGDLQKGGELRYHLTVTDEKGAVLGELGSRSAPMGTEIKSKIAGEPPRWPGFAPPEPCGAAKVDAGPSQCLDDRQCSAGLMCREGSCVERPTDPAESKVARRWVTLSFSPDVSIVSGDEVCTAAGQTDGHFVCYREDDTRYVGTPATGPDTANNINTGPALSTMRLLIGFDYLLIDQLALGVRAGYAFGGATDAGASFLPLHVEGRATVWPLGKAPEQGSGARPFGFVGGGLAQIDTRVPVEVLADPIACGPVDADGFCSNPSADGVKEKRIQTLDAYKQAGQGFATFGVGIAYAPMPVLALLFSVRGSVTFPVVTGVISPELGVSFGF